jgi:uncharacterized membrane protein (DUF106 family)
MRDQTEEMRESTRNEDFKIDPKQMEQLRQQMDELRKSFKAKDFKLDPKIMDQLKEQMEHLRRQMEEMKALRFGNTV